MLESCTEKVKVMKNNNSKIITTTYLAQHRDTFWRHLKPRHTLISPKSYTLLFTIYFISRDQQASHSLRLV